MVPELIVLRLAHHQQTKPLLSTMAKAKFQPIYKSASRILDRSEAVPLENIAPTPSTEDDVPEGSASVLLPRETGARAMKSCETISAI